MYSCALREGTSTDPGTALTLCKIRKLKSDTSELCCCGGEHSWAINVMPWHADLLNDEVEYVPCGTRGLMVLGII